MKKFFLVLFVLITYCSIAQVFDYKEKWDEVEKLSQEGNFKSLLPKVDLIYLQAKKDNNPSEIIKSLVAQAQISAQTQENEGQNPYLQVIQKVEETLKTSQGITTSVLQSLLAKIYYDYWSNTRWQRQNITETDQVSADITTWTSDQLLKKSLDLYQQSIQDKELLQKEKIKNWRDILTSTEDEEIYPTLYDVLVNRYINILNSGQYTNVLSSKELNSVERETKKDSILKNETIQLVNFHQNDINKSAYLNAKLTEIQKFSGNKLKPGERAGQIIQLAEQYPNENFSAYLYYNAASEFRDSDKVKAMAICDKVSYNDKNPWSINCNALQESIKTIGLITTIDKVQLPNQPISLTLNATNIDKVYYRVYEVNPYSDYSRITMKNSQLVNEGIISIAREKKVKEGEYQLKKFSDFNPHSTIVKLEGLPQGNYIIEFSNSPDFPKAKQDMKSILGSTYFMVNNWTVVQFNGENSTLYQLVDRKTGEVLKNIDLQVFKRLSYYDKKPKMLGKFMDVKTDEKGVFNLEKGENTNYGAFYVYNPVAQSYILLPSSYYYGRSYNNSGENRVTSIFTDRTIYRPEQTIYYKAILYTKNKDQAVLAKKQKVTLFLYNTNGEKVASQDLTTNEYGSVFGEFILPQGGLTGRYSISSSGYYGSKNISVEEYKRPKFEVTLEKTKGEYTLNQEVKTTGQAISYAGAPISEAKVVYRVERKEIFPYFRWYYPPMENSSPETITQGELTTDGEGNFTIPFIAEPKNEKKEGEYRTYTYTVYADVTDINGETHSANQEVTIGDLPKKLILIVPEISLQKDFKQLVIQSTNLNGVKEQSQGEIKITTLESPKKVVLPNKQNSVPDYQLYEEVEFNSYFPYFPYSKQETNIKSQWKKGKVKIYPFNTQKSDTVKLTSQLPAGYYQIEAYSLYGKDTIRTEQIVEIQNSETLQSANNIFFTASTSKTTYKPEEEIEINFFSDLKEATAILRIESASKWMVQEQIPIKNGKATYKLKADRKFIADGLFVSTYMVKDNGYLSNNFQIKVAEAPKDLQIKTKVFRDKLAPGAKETWELTISGKDKDQVAEVLATMYDASLDQFQANSFSFSPLGYSPYGILYRNLQTLGYDSHTQNLRPNYFEYAYRYPHLINLKDFSLYGFSGYFNLLDDVVAVGAQVYANARYKGRNTSASVFSDEKDYIMGYDGVVANYEQVFNDDIVEMGNVSLKQQLSKPDLSQVQVRTNLQETAFFYPNLYTDANGDVKLTFTSPEALTKWKLLLLAHTPDLYTGTAEFYTQTQKDLMVVPNVPRFLREGDQVIISTKINNLSGKKLSGKAQLFLFDALTGKSVDTDFSNTQSQLSFKTEASKNAEVSWTLKVPYNVQAVTYKIVAQAGNFSDGEESTLPILSNRMLVTETLPISIKENQTKEFRLDKLVNQSSATLQNFNLSLEVTTNPTWLAVFSLPYLREYPYECSEQLFSRLYGNILSTYILNSSPKIKKVFEDWNAKGINISNLERNQELKNILLAETPWVRNAQSENEQKKRMALLFDLNKMSQENDQAQKKLLRRQKSDGGFAWFDGGESSPYITQTIILGFGQLRNMLKDQSGDYLNKNLDNLIGRAISYSDNQVIADIKRAKKDKQEINGKSFINYYYVRSFWKDKYPLPKEISEYLPDIDKDVTSYFKGYDLQNKAMAAIVLNRYGYTQTAQAIVHNLKETSVEADEMGMYWKNNHPGWFWYQTPVESQTRAIEAFAEITPNDIQAVEEMKVWLLKNKQTNAWNSTKATTNAVYALMNFGKDWSNAEEGVKVFIGNQLFYPSKETTPEQAAGYIKKSWNAQEIKPDMGVVKIEKTSPGVAWGGLYWQYFEDLDKITSADTNIKMQKQLFLKTNTNKGQQLKEITDKNAIKVGDLLTIRLVIKTDRDMEYIHIKDMRASGLEPVNVLSQYKYQNGAGYYESTKDAATDFFFERFPKGTYVFEYEVRANNAGDFSNGITQLQNMYAPEMSTHSEGTKVEIKK